MRPKVTVYAGEALIRRHKEHLEDMIRIQKKKTEIKESIPHVILSPPVARRFIEKYLLENLNAEKIFNRQSAFRLEDVTRQQPRFHERFSLLHNPCRAMHTGSFPMDKQGIPAKILPFIEKGRLINAVVSLRGAKQSGWQPTALANPDSLILQGDREENLYDFIREAENAFLVTSVPGLHTQDSGRGIIPLQYPTALSSGTGKCAVPPKLY